MYVKISNLPPLFARRTRRTATFHFLFHLTPSSSSPPVHYSSWIETFSLDDPQWKIAAHLWLIALIITAICQTTEKLFVDHLKFYAPKQLSKCRAEFLSGNLLVSHFFAFAPFTFKWCFVSFNEEKVFEKLSLSESDLQVFASSSSRWGCEKLVYIRFQWW